MGWKRRKKSIEEQGRYNNERHEREHNARAGE